MTDISNAGSLLTLLGPPIIGGVAGAYLVPKHRVLGVVGGLAAGVVVTRLLSYAANSAAASNLNAKCVADRALAQEASSATPERSLAIRRQVEQENGAAFLSDLEWSQWIAAQQRSTCSATA